MSSLCVLSWWAVRGPLQGPLRLREAQLFGKWAQPGPCRQACLLPVEQGCWPPPAPGSASAVTSSRKPAAASLQPTSSQPRALLQAALGWCVRGPWGPHCSSAPSLCTWEPLWGLRGSFPRLASPLPTPALTSPAAPPTLPSGVQTVGQGAADPRLGLSDGGFVGPVLRGGGPLWSPPGQGCGSRAWSTPWYGPRRWGLWSGLDAGQRLPAGAHH